MAKGIRLSFRKEIFVKENVDSHPGCLKRPRVYQSATVHRLHQADKALQIVNGNFTLAGRLLGLTPLQCKNLVNANAWLKTRWGHGRRGRPKGGTSVHKLVFDGRDEIPKDPRSCAAQCLALFEQLPLQEQRRVHDAIRIRTLGRAMAASLVALRVRSAVIHSLSLLALRERRDDGGVRPES